MKVFLYFCHSFIEKSCHYHPFLLINISYNKNPIVTMKKFMTLALLTVLSLTANAQNIQLHYDFGRHLYPNEEETRQIATLTFEHYRPDRLGSIFYFIDLDIYAKGLKGAYLEFSREFNIGKKGFAIHGEYNGGCTTSKGATWAAQFQHAFLLGPAFNWHNSDYSFTCGVQAMYKHYLKGVNNAKAYPGFQLTGVWGWTFGKEKMFTFSGFIDFWRNHKGNDEYNVIMLTEPQFWFNLNGVTKAKTNLSIGTEIEISNNFVINEANSKTFFVNPTLALKWTM